jgi:signal transduction histidine kinase/ActR/RegA family two-component response regulator
MASRPNHGKKMTSSIITKFDKLMSGRIVYALMTLISVGLLISVIISGYQLSFIKSEKQTSQENYSWAIAKLAIKLAEFNTLVEQKANNANDSFDDMSFKLDILFSRVNILRNRSTSTEWLYKESEYKKTIDTIYNKIETIDDELHKSHPNYIHIKLVSNSITPFINLLANIADHAEVHQRDANYQKYINAKTSLNYFILMIGIIGLFIVIVNIRQYVNVSESLKDKKQAFENKNAFLGVLGHELRTSLQAIISSIDLLKDGTHDDKSIQILERAANQMERQMYDLSEFAKVDNGIIEINETFFNLHSVLESLIHESNLSNPSSDVRILNNTKPSLIVFTDKTRLSQIIKNLLSNSMKHTAHGHIEFEANIEKYTLNFCITDTGAGIPTDKLEQIFKPFIRANSSAPGFGMGLAIVHGLVKRMGGVIDIKSELTIGTSVSISLPTKSQAEIPMDIQEHIEHSNLVSASHAEKLTILLIDDNELICNSLKTLLVHCGHTVESTTQPERAWQKIQRKPFDVVLTDLQMPFISGDELLRKTRSQKGPNVKTPFIFITAYSIIPGSLVEECVVITKPVRRNDLVMAIAKTYGPSNKQGSMPGLRPPHN